MDGSWLGRHGDKNGDLNKLNEKSWSLEQARGVILVYAMY
jgi:hypothetical protein